MTNWWERDQLASQPQQRMQYAGSGMSGGTDAPAQERGAWWAQDKAIQSDQQPVSVAGSERSTFAPLLDAVRNTFMGVSSGTQPHVIDPKTGGYLRRPLGLVALEDDAGNLYFRDPAGRPVPVDQKSMVVLTDPASGHPMVFERDPEWDESGAAGAARILTQGLATGPVAGPQRAATAPPTSAMLATARAEHAADDLAAFERQGVRPFGPAFNQGPTASVAKQLSETPIIGAPIKNALDESLTDASLAVQRVADRISPVATHDIAGRTLQQGLDRFRTAGVEGIEPGVLAERGINPTAPVQRADMMSAAAAGRAQQAEPIRQQLGGGQVPTSRGVQVPASGTRNQTLMARRGADDLSDAELTTLIRAPAQDTSFAVRSEALYERAWRAIPNQFRIDASRNPQRLNAVNTRAAMGRADREVASQIAGQGRITGELAERLRNPRSHFGLDDLRGIRTEIGRALGNFGMYDQRLDRSQLRSLYGAVSRDIEVGLQDLANRSYLQTRVSPNRPDYIAPDVARAADRALREFLIADRYFRAGQQRMDSFMRLLNADNPEAAATRLVQAATDRGKGNLGMLQTARAALRPEEWGDISALVLRNLGRPVPSARQTAHEIDFSASSFLTNWERMEPRARELLFGGEHARDIDDVVRISTRLANVEALANTSRSGTNALNLSGLAGAGGAVMAGADAMLTAGGVAGSGLAMSVLLSRPAWARWAVGYTRARAALARGTTPVNRARIITQINQLGRLAAHEPTLLPIYHAIARENGIRPGAAVEGEKKQDMREDKRNPDQQQEGE